MQNTVWRDTGALLGQGWRACRVATTGFSTRQPALIFSGFVVGREKVFMLRVLSLLRGAMRSGARSWAKVEVIQLVRVTLDAAFSSWFLTSCSDVRRRGGADAGSSTLRCQAT